MPDIPPDNGEAMMQMLERIKQLEKANQNISTEAMKAHQRVAELEADREYNAGLVKAAEKRLDAADKLADAAQVFFIQQHGDLASANECPYSNCAALREKFKAYEAARSGGEDQ